MIELFPCPFCGGCVDFTEAHGYYTDLVLHCDCCDMIFSLNNKNATKEEIAEVWNRRAEV